MPGYGQAPLLAPVQPGTFARVNTPVISSRAVTPPTAGPGLVGVRNQSPRGFVTGQTSQTYRLKYRCAVAASGLRLDFPAWTTQAAGIGDTATGNTVNLGAVYVERSGTLYPVTFNSGSSTAAITSGGQVTSDPVAGLTVAAGDILYIRTYVTVASGGQWPNLYGAYVYPDELSRPGANLANATGDLSGTGAVNTSLYGPMRVWAPRTPGEATYNISVGGDSIVAGVNDSFSDESQTGYWQRVLYAGNRPYELVMLPSESAFQFITNQGLLRSGLTGDYANYFVSEYGINDLQQGQTLAQLQASILKVDDAANDPGIIAKFQQTLGPKSSSTDGWATTANQTTDGINTIRVQFNDWVRDGMPINTSGVAVATGTSGAIRHGNPAHPYQGYLEIADLCESARNSGLWKPGYTNDGLHPGPTGNASMAAAMAPQMDTWFPNATSVAAGGSGGGGGSTLARVAASSPVIRSSAFQGSSNTQAWASNSFDPPASSLIVVVGQATQAFNNTWNTATITDSLGSHLTWTRLDQQADVSFSGVDTSLAIFYALCPSAQTGMTVTVTQSCTAGQTITFSSVDVHVFTGHDTTTPVASLAKGILTNNALSVSATPGGASGSFLFLAANNAAAASGASSAGAGEYLASETHTGTSFATAWYGASTGPTLTTGAQTLDLTGATARWQYIAFEVRGATASSSYPVSGSSPIFSATSGAVSAALAVSGTSDIVSTTTGAANVGSNLGVTGQVDIVSASTGSVTLTHPASGTVTATTASSGAVTLTHPAAGQVDIVSTTSGTAQAILGSAGTVTASSTTSGTVTLTHPVSSSNAIVSTTSGSPSSLQGVSGSNPVVTTTSGAPAVAGASGLNGTVTITSTTTGTVAARLAGTGQVDIVSASSGALASRQAVTGTAAVTTASSGDTTLTHPVAGTVAAVTASSGSPTVLGATGLVGTVSVTSASSGTVTARYAVSGTVTISSDSTGTVGQRQAVVAAVVVVSTSQGDAGSVQRVTGVVTVLSATRGAAGFRSGATVVPRVLVALLREDSRYAGTMRDHDRYGARLL